jgi:hypothetical protein
LGQEVFIDVARSARFFFKENCIMTCIIEKMEHTSLYEVKWYMEGLFWVAYEQSAYFV